jgi:hypothetical protein
MNVDSRYAARRVAAAAAVFLAAASAGCDTPSGPRADEGEEPTLRALLLAPAEQTVQAGATLQFQAQGILSDGGTSPVAVSWSATGGTITSGGLYTAGQAAGAFRVIATAGNGVADTASVIVAVPTQNPVLVAVVVTPASATVAPGGTVQLAAAGLLSSGAATPVAVAWSATGGSVSGTGLYTAGAAAGSFRVIATGPGGLADTAAIAVAAGGGHGYTTVQGDDWKGYRSDAELRGAGFWWFRSEDVHQYVHLAQDPVFGQVVKVTFQQSTDIGWAPSLDRSFAQPLDRMWFRYRVRYAPGWTTVGPLPSGHANAWKQAFWLWDGYQGRGQIEISNTDEYVPGFGVSSSGSYLRYTERPLPGSGTLGRVTTEWTDGQWWEFVVYYEKTGATTARQHWWKRRLTNGGAIADNPWSYVGLEASGATTPRVRGITLGANKNKSNPTTMHLYWGPWEVVDGARHPNPWGMPLP